MTEAEYDARLRQWAQGVRSRARLTLSSGTHGTGQLSDGLRDYVDKMRDGSGRHIAFRFESYGVFRHYGAGRGWVVVNGRAVPGYRVVSLKDRYRTAGWDAEAREMLKRGFSRNDVRSAKRTTNRDPRKKREPLDWLDGQIRSGASELADISQSYWGDVALQAISQQIEQARIDKH